MRRQGERLRTPNDCREILFKRSDVELETAMTFRAGTSTGLGSAAQVPQLNFAFQGESNNVGRWGPVALAPKC